MMARFPSSLMTSFHSIVLPTPPLVGGGASQSRRSLRLGVVHLSPGSDGPEQSNNGSGDAWRAGDTGRAAAAPAAAATVGQRRHLVFSAMDGYGRCC